MYAASSPTICYSKYVGQRALLRYDLLCYFWIVVDGDVALTTAVAAAVVDSGSNAKAKANKMLLY